MATENQQCYKELDDVGQARDTAWPMHQQIQLMKSAAYTDLQRMWLISIIKGYEPNYGRLVQFTNQ